jgi:hypothetical protein
MCFTAIATGIGLALSAVGLGVQIKSANDAADAQEDAEAARKKQMELDALRRRREAVREAIAARSLALSNATAQGAGEGSGLLGGYAQIAGQAGRNILATNQNVELGGQIYDANSRYASAQSAGAAGSGLVDIGKTVLANNTKIGQIADTVRSGGLFS